MRGLQPQNEGQIQNQHQILPLLVNFGVFLLTHGMAYSTYNSLVYYLPNINGWCISDLMFAKSKCVCEVADIFKFLCKTFLTYIMKIVE